MKSLNIYKQKFKEFGADPKSLQWKTKGAAHQRFRQFWAEIDFDDKSVLDVGCGFGEMGNFLTKRYDNVKYKGVDIMGEFISKGKEMYPHLDLIEGDYFNQPLPEMFDVVICSGALNSNFGTDIKNYEFRKKAIKVMFEHANKVMAFNMLGSSQNIKNKKDSNVWYANSLEIIKYCFSLTRRILFRHHYHPKDFTIFMYKTSK